LSLLEPAVGLCRRAELWVLFPRVAAWLGSAYTLAGRVGEAIALLEESVTRARSLTVIYLLGDIERRLGEAYLAAGRTAEAAQILPGALGFVRDRQEQGSEAELLRVLGDLAQARAEPDLEVAAAHYRDATALADRLGMRPTVARCLMALGRASRRQGRSSDARAALGQAVEQLRDMGMGFWLLQAEAELTQVS
jgi:tetratricopeptide (TPR) repeat protein